MGYTHYWYRPEQLNADKFKQFTNDCKKIIEYSVNDLGIDIANGLGEGEPEITESLIRFNGSDMQRVGVYTTNEDISIPWPTSTASLNEVSADPCSNKTEGTWFAGSLVTQRVAPLNNMTGYGSGSYETFSIELNETAHEGESLASNCTKTAYRPYDLTITACLIAFKFHFGGLVKVVTDGEEKDWLDGRILCNNLLGYGLDLDIFAKVTEKPAPKPTKQQEEYNKADHSKSCKEIAAEIRQTIGKTPGVKLSVTSDHNHINIKLLRAPFECWDDETLKAKGRANINQYHMNNEKLTEECRAFWNKVQDIINKYFWDLSDSQSDYFHRAFYYDYSIGDWKKPVEIVIPEPAKVSAPEQIKPAVQIIDYSEKAIAVIGETKAIRETLKSLGGRFNMYLSCGAGWIFPKTKEQQVRAAL